jgi:uncharacterized protein YeaO (DUF488 family)
MTIKLKRVYDSPTKSDGCRILVDRLWPRGLQKEKGQIDLWLKEVAPTTALRKWFGHDLAKWKEFKKRYFAELDDRASVVEELAERASRSLVTLVYSARDPEHNNAIALHEYLKLKMRP